MFGRGKFFQAIIIYIGKLMSLTLELLGQASALLGNIELGEIKKMSGAHTLAFSATS
jgi:hypothetical protein